MDAYKKIFLGVLFLAGLSFPAAHIFAETEIGSDISVDATWVSAESPYIVSGDINVLPGTTLTIEPGVIVKFDSGAGLFVIGTLHAEGTENSPIVFTSLLDDTGGDTNGDGGESLPSPGDWNRIYFFDYSKLGTNALAHVQIRYAGGVTTIQSAPAFSLTDVAISNSLRGLDVFDSTVSFSNLHIDHIEDDGLVAYTSSKLSGLDLTLDTVSGTGVLLYGGAILSGNSIFVSNPGDSGITVFSNAEAHLNNANFKGLDFRPAAEVFDGGSLVVSGGVFKDGGGDAIDIFSHGSIDLKDVTIENFLGDAVGDFGDNSGAGPNTIIIHSSKIQNNFGGINIYRGDSSLDISGNAIVGNAAYGANTYLGTGVQFVNNWWGDPSGPYNANSNSEGSGDSISDGIVANPWLASDPFAPAEVCCSSVLFIPGLQASRLYKRGNIFNRLDQLWEPNNNADVRDLAMNDSGVSQNANIYTKDIIGRTNVFSPYDVNVYSAFIAMLDRMVEDQQIAKWSAIPYDWRYAPDYVVTHGTMRDDGTIIYTGNISSGQKPAIVSALEDLAASSLSGKVTIVTHSNGGLVVKALFEKLAQMQASGESDLITKIDRIVMVAAPEMGTPDAVGKMLHGLGMEIGGGFILKPSTARGAAQNMPGVYGLLPSQKYFDTVIDPVIEFDPSIDSISNLRTTYGDAITTYTVFKDFLTGAQDKRLQPSSSDTFNPLKLSSILLAQAGSLHQNIDGYQYPSSVEVDQVIGWGLPTVRGLKYLAKADCFFKLQSLCKKSLDVQPLITNDGDKTVVTSSAMNFMGNKFYLNLKDYNNTTKTNYEHKDILETTSAQSLIQNLLLNKQSNIPYISSTKPTDSTDLKTISVHSPVTLGVYDAEGRYTGTVESPIADFDRVEEGIPNSSYLNFGEGKYVSVPNGAYSISLDGLDFGTFTLTIDHMLNGQSVTEDSVSFADIPVTPLAHAELAVSEEGSSAELKVDIDGDGVFDQAFDSNTDSDPIAYLEMLKKTILSLDLRPTVEKLLLKKIEKLEKAVKSGKIKDIRHKLRGLFRGMKFKEGHHKRFEKLKASDQSAIVDMITGLLDNLK